jgi:hypothetical protein
MPIQMPRARYMRALPRRDRRNERVGLMVLVPMSAQPSAPSCSRGRARPGGGAAAGDPAAARAFIRLDHERVSTRDRCRGDHRHDPCAARTDGARQRRPRALRPGRAAHTGGSAHMAQPPAGPRQDSAASPDCGSKLPPRRRRRCCSGAADSSRLLQLDLSRTEALGCPFGDRSGSSGAVDRSSLGHRLLPVQTCGGRR